MKKETFYVCEECGLKYKDKEEASKCENRHPKKLEIIKKRYWPRESVPKYLEIQTETGETFIYCRETRR
jgi:hypothetical protein